MKIGLFADAQSVHIHQLVAGLIQRGHDVTVITHKPAEIPGVAVEPFHVPRPGLMNPRRWTSRKLHYLQSFLKRFDILNIHFLQDWGFPVEWMDQHCFVATAWGSDIVDPPGETHANHELISARKNLLQHASAVTTCGPSFANTVANYANLQREAIDVVPFGVNLTLFNPDGATEKNLSQDLRQNIVIGFYKGFREVYGPTTLIRAIPSVIDRHPDVRFELVGDGPQLETCQSLAKKLNADHAINWIPRQTLAQIPFWLNHWTITVIPSIHEAFGVAALESSAMRLPVIASDVCGLRDTVLHNETGLLTPVNDSDALTVRINQLLDDPVTAQQMGRAGRQMVKQQYDWEILYDQWISTYEKALDLAAIMV